MSYVTPVHHDTWRRTSILGPFGFAYRSARVYGGFVLDGCVVESQIKHANVRLAIPTNNLSKILWMASCQSVIE